MFELAASAFQLFDPFQWASSASCLKPLRVRTPLPSMSPAKPRAEDEDYSVFVPDTPSSRRLSMVVMLHGAGQDPDDFAAGTAMNEAAQRRGFIVLYPRQSVRANAFRCWNWFDPAHQRRDVGEPGRIVAMTRKLAAQHGVDLRQIYVAGLSAGGAMASLLGELYPELFSAVGVHSGLASFAAHDLHSRDRRGGLRRATVPSGIPTIVFHGDKDSTVDPVNGMHVIDAAFGPECIFRSTVHQSVDGSLSTRRRYFKSGARKCCGEHWTLHNAAHAWSGGNASGSFAQPRGPAASDEMLRFFAARTLN